MRRGDPAKPSAHRCSRIDESSWQRARETLTTRKLSYRFALCSDGPPPCTLQTHTGLLCLISDPSSPTKHIAPLSRAHPSAPVCPAPAWPLMTPTPLWSAVFHPLEALFHAGCVKVSGACSARCALPCQSFEWLRAPRTVLHSNALRFGTSTQKHALAWHRILDQSRSPILPKELMDRAPAADSLWHPFHRTVQFGFPPMTVPDLPGSYSGVTWCPRCAWMQAPQQDIQEATPQARPLSIQLRRDSSTAARGNINTPPGYRNAQHKRSTFRWRGHPLRQYPGRNDEIGPTLCLPIRLVMGSSLRLHSDIPDHTPATMSAHAWDLVPIPPLVPPPEGVGQVLHLPRAAGPQHAFLQVVLHP